MTLYWKALHEEEVFGGDATSLGERLMDSNARLRARVEELEAHIASAVDECAVLHEERDKWRSLATIANNIDKAQETRERIESKYGICQECETVRERDRTIQQLDMTDQLLASERDEVATLREERDALQARCDAMVAALLKVPGKIRRQSETATLDWHDAPMANALDALADEIEAALDATGGE